MSEDGQPDTQDILITENYMREIGAAWDEIDEGEDDDE